MRLPALPVSCLSLCFLLTLPLASLLLLPTVHRCATSRGSPTLAVSTPPATRETFDCTRPRASLSEGVAYNSTPAHQECLYDLPSARQDMLDTDQNRFIYMIQIDARFPLTRPGIGCKYDGENVRKPSFVRPPNDCKTSTASRPPHRIH